MKITEQLPYNGESFESPRDYDFEGMGAFDGKPKVYSMAYLQGCPHVEVESYPGEGVMVTYLITGVTYTWSWKNRSKAWEWAKARKAHIEGLKSNYYHTYI